jgi:hypothetical protein
MRKHGYHEGQSLIPDRSDNFEFLEVIKVILDYEDNQLWQQSSSYFFNSDLLWVNYRVRAIFGFLSNPVIF